MKKFENEVLVIFVHICTYFLWNSISRRRAIISSNVQSRSIAKGKRN